MSNNELSELVINALRKRFGIRKGSLEAEGLTSEERKAEIKREGKRVTLIPKSNIEYIPNLVINDIDVFEKVLIRYLKTIKKSQIKSTEMDERHNEKYFLFNVWKNATMYDFQNPEKFINRYTNFILDNTFSRFDVLKPLGYCEGNILMAQREEDDYGFETPYIMHLSFSNGRSIYNLPWIRYGITQNRLGEKIAYIYALQRMEQSSDEEYNKKISKMLNQANTGAKSYRNVTPSSIAALTVFMGMLEREEIKAIKAPDFLIGRYGGFANSTTEEETDRIQTNLTDKFLRNFLRLSEQFDGLKIETGIGNGLDSFLCMSLGDMTNSSNEFLNLLYSLGRGRCVPREMYGLEEEL